MGILSTEGIRQIKERTLRLFSDNPGDYHFSYLYYINCLEVMVGRLVRPHTSPLVEKITRLPHRVNNKIINKNRRRLL
jgi:hypothetical protein